MFHMFGDEMPGGFPGGMPGMGGGGPRGPVDNSEYYEALGVEKDATAAQIKKAFRKLALKKHPDRGGDPAEFQALSHAHDVLSDPEKRELYDKYGKDFEEGGGGGDPSDIFSQFFGGGGRGGGGRSRGPRKGEDLVHPLRVSLEDLYNGKTCRLAINRDKLCSGCEGRGGAEGCERNCEACGGRGVRIHMRQIAPSMVQQQQVVCGECRGQGKIMNEADRCRDCRGNKTSKERKILEVVIERGAKHGQKITFPGDADEAPGTVPGDVVFVVQEREHETFQRKGQHLVMKKEVTLAEALCGTDFTVTHLDGRVLRVRTQPGEVIQPDMVKSIANEGMPLDGGGIHRGRLLIKFEVQFPEDGAFTDAQVQTLLSVFPDRPRPTLSGEEEDVELGAFDPEMLNEHRGRGGGAAYDSDDEAGGGGGQRVQCANQ